LSDAKANSFRTDFSRCSKMELLDNTLVLFRHLNLLGSFTKFNYIARHSLKVLVEVGDETPFGPVFAKMMAFCKM